MKRRPQGSLSLSKAIPGFLQFKAAEGLSPNTLQSYQRDLKLWQIYGGDILVDHISTHLIQDYLIWLRTDYTPRRITGNRQALASKTIHNFYISLCAFFTWACREFDFPNPIKAVPAPKFEQAPIEPFTKVEVESLLKACEFSAEVRPIDRRRYVMHRWADRRDQAVILTLLDTGLRASELAALKVGDVDLKSGKVLVKHGQLGWAKGGKGRTVYLGKAARRAVWRYLAEREDGEDPSAPLFLVRYDKPMTRNALRLLMARLGKKAGVKNCHPPGSDTRSLSPISALAAMCSPFKRCWGTAHSTWCNTTRASRRSMLSKLTAAPVLPTIGDCDWILSPF